MAFILSFVSSPARAATSREIDRAIERGKAYLYSRMNKFGNWEQSSRPIDDAGAYNNSITGGQWGGLTALACYALLSDGDNPRGTRLIPAVRFLLNADVRGTYALGLRAQVWTFISTDSLVRRAALRDANLLLSGMQKAVAQPNGQGMFGYRVLSATGGHDLDSYWDHSCSQFGVLGFWALEETGVFLPDKYWRLMDAGWRRDQLSDGGWCYHDKPTVDLVYPPPNPPPPPSGPVDTHHYGGFGDLPPGAAVPQVQPVKPVQPFVPGKLSITPIKIVNDPETVTFTNAAIASLFITDDYLHSSEAFACHGGWTDRAITRGLDWIDKNVDSAYDAHAEWLTYALYTIERIGVASGRKTLGNSDWYQRGADLLLSLQKDNGSWDVGPDPVVDTSLALLFLVRGRAPVVMNKLDYASAAGSSEWDQRPRDVAHLALWLSATLESSRPLNSQTVQLSSDPDTWHDSPILLICGRDELQFTQDQKEKLRRFVEDGGLILFNADCGASDSFTNSVKELGHDLFDRDFRPLPADHPIFLNEEFLRRNWRTKPVVLGLSNGARELMLLIPGDDPSGYWQINDATAHPEAFELATDLFLYATDEQHLSSREESTLVNRNRRIHARQTITIARLRYGEDQNWNPEPGGWRRLSAVTHNRDRIDLDVRTVTLGDASALSSNEFQIAHLTGAGPITLSPAARTQIKQFVENGGTLIVDAVGGNKTFADSARTELDSIFGDEAKQLDTPLPLDHPFYSSGDRKMTSAEIEYRRYAQKILAMDLHQPRLRAMAIKGRLAVFFSAEDLSAGLVGQNVDGIIGYTPDLAIRLMERMILSGAP